MTFDENFIEIKEKIKKNNKKVSKTRKINNPSQENKKKTKRKPINAKWIRICVYIVIPEFSFALNFFLFRDFVTIYIDIHFISL